MRRLLLFFTMSILICLFTNCSFFGRPLDDTNTKVKSPNTEVGNLDPERAAGERLYASHCAGCHGSIENSSKKNKSAADITSAIAFQGSMKFLSFLSAADIQRIALALSPESGQPPGGIEIKMASKVEVRVSNRYLKDSTLREIFVADTGLDADDLKISKIIDANIKSHPEAFGGNCSRYDAGCMPKICGVKGSDPCEAELAVKMSASPSPGASVLRKGYTSRTCEEILAVDKSVTTALTKAEIKNETQINPLPNSDNIQAFLNFYYSDRPSTKESLETLEKLVSDAKSKGMSTLDQWRFVILPICMSTGADLL